MDKEEAIGGGLPTFSLSPLSYITQVRHMILRVKYHSHSTLDVESQMLDVIIICSYKAEMLERSSFHALYATNRAKVKFSHFCFAFLLEMIRH